MEMNNDIFTPNLPIPEPVSFEDAPIPIPVEEEKPAETPPPRRRRKADAPVLTIESGDEIETEDAREAAAWHEIHNAYRTRRILSAPLGGIEQTDSGKTIAVVDYNGFLHCHPPQRNDDCSQCGQQCRQHGCPPDETAGQHAGRRNRLCHPRYRLQEPQCGCQPPRSHDGASASFSISAPMPTASTRVREGRVVQARVIAVADKSIRVEIFGVECSIMARDLAWDWIGDAHDRFAVGDQILVGVTR